MRNEIYPPICQPKLFYFYPSDVAAEREAAAQPASSGGGAGLTVFVEEGEPFPMFPSTVERNLEIPLLLVR